MTVVVGPTFIACTEDISFVILTENEVDAETANITVITKLGDPVRLASNMASADALNLLWELQNGMGKPTHD
jgi:hypothetical protein